MVLHILTIEKIKTILDNYGVQTEYSHFSEPVTPPYITFLSSGTENMAADNVVYKVIENFKIELYSRVNVYDEESKLGSYLTLNELMWDKEEAIWIDEEKLYMTVFNIS
ncbi:hypothetical protein [Anaerorhabdus sp.]|uniref:hypothetical protein n=1 Tax=Anaerorhabdus sp. TaxID=1872524 RepID=UPI002FC78619